MPPYYGLLGASSARKEQQKAADIYLVHRFDDEGDLKLRVVFTCPERGMGFVYVQHAFVPEPEDGDDEDDDQDGQYEEEDDEEGEEEEGYNADTEGEDNDSEEDGYQDEEGEDGREEGEGRDGDNEEEGGEDEEEGEVDDDDDDADDQEELHWLMEPANAGHILVRDYGQADVPPNPNPPPQPITDWVIDGVLTAGYDVPWDHDVVTTNLYQPTLHYHQHERRLKKHGTQPPPILPQNRGKHHEIQMLKYGSQVQLFRRSTKP
ncbi:hypothetical protein OF83DRAFT_128539 [Amylostereum chailletii]|nr:hypothetical protein OF83DRAFT_128539 [Amylostereum chailletii]